MTTIIEKNTVSCFEKVAENLIALVKQQLNVHALLYTGNIMEVEDNSSLPQSLHCYSNANSRNRALLNLILPVLKLLFISKRMMILLKCWL